MLPCAPVRVKAALPDAAEQHLPGSYTSLTRTRSRTMVVRISLGERRTVAPGVARGDAATGRPTTGGTMDEKKKDTDAKVKDLNPKAIDEKASDKVKGGVRTGDDDDINDLEIQRRK
jgi:hypothetical protein